MPVSRLPAPATYAELKKAVETVVFQGRQQIEQAWTKTYHETGRLINEHILRNAGRAGYGARVFERLAADTGISKRTLHECAQFHRCFPIVRLTAQLTRTHYIVLCQVADEKLALPGWYVVPQGIGAVLVLNHKQLAPTILRTDAGRLTPAQVDLISRQLDDLCRDVED